MADKKALRDAAVAAAIGGIGVAAVAGLAVGALAGAGLLTMSSAVGRRGSKPPLLAKDIKWDAEGQIENWGHVLKAVQQGGLEPAARAAVWPLLLGVFPPNSTQAERDAELERLHRLYTKLVLVCQELDRQIAALRDSTGGAGTSAAGTASAAGSGDAAEGAAAADAAGGAAASGSASSSPERGAPPLPGNLAVFGEAHRIIVIDAVRTDIQRQQQGGPIGGGPPSPTVTILPVSAGDGLPELMLVQAPEREASPAEAVSAGRLPRWRSALAAGALDGATHLNAHSRAAMLRLVNLLSAYAVHDPETGYCQGMSDLGAIFVALFDDDALAFACYERLMRSARRNFCHDERGIKHQLSQIGRILRDTDPSLHRKLAALEAEDCMFAYRMVVVMLRRELPAAECCTLWEVQWALEAGLAAEAAAAAAGAPPPEALVCRTNSGSGGSTTAGMAAASGVSPAIQSTVAGLADASARAAAEASAARPGSAGARHRADRHGGGRAGSGKRGGRLVPAGSGGAPAGGGGKGSSGSQEAEPPELLLHFIAAVVRSQRARILGECATHDDVLRLFGTVRVDFWLSLAQARKQFKAYTQGALVMQRL